MNELARGTSQTSQTSDYTGWLTKAEAAAAIGVTTKTVERLAEKGKIQQAFTQRQGRGPTLAVYHPDDVARFAQERRTAPAAFVLPAGVTSPVNGNGHGSSSGLQIAAAAPPPGDDVLRLVFAAALRAVSETSETPAAYVDKAEALVITGVSYAQLRAAVRAGEVKQRGTRYRRKDLEAL